MGRTTPADGFDRFDQFLSEWSRRDFLRRMGGAAAFAAFSAGGLGWLEACGGNQAAKTDTGKAVKGGHIIEGSISDIGNLNPIFTNDTASLQVTYRLYDGLLDAEANGTLVPNLATAVPKPESDQLSYRVTLKKGLKWSDGSAITADDVVFTYQLMFDPKYAAVKSRYRAQLTEYLASVTAVDPQTVLFKTTKVYAPFVVTFMVLGILPKAVWEKLAPADVNSTEMNQVPTVVSGAMLPVKWDKGSQYTLRRNDNWHQGKTFFDTYIFKVVPDAVAIANQLKTGELDVGIVDKSQWDSLATAQNVSRVGFVAPSFDYYLQNLDASKTPKAAIFGDLQVRKALLMALDRKKIADKVYFGQAVSADSSIGLVSPAHITPKAQYPFDAKKAEQMLDDAGWKKGADGIRAKNGVRMEWELRTNVGNKVRETLIQVMAEQWSGIGVKVTTKPVQFPQLVTQLSSTREFEMILLGISESIDPDQTQLWSSKSIGGGALNGAGYKNDKVDQLLSDAVQTLDQKKRLDMYHQIQEILLQDLPSPLIVYPKANWGISKRVKNFNVGGFSQYQYRTWFKDVYVTDGK